MTEGSAGQPSSATINREQQRFASVLTVIFAVALTAAHGFLSLFATFYQGDDEGFFLLGTLNFSKHGHLYSGVFASVYGPVPYLVHGAVHRLGVGLGSDYARWYALGVWLTTALLCGSIVWTATKSLTWFAITTWFVSSYFSMTTSEPFHPSMMITLLIVVIAWVGSRKSMHPGILGAVSALILFTKVNCGIFVWIACLAWLMLPFVRKRSRVVAPAVMLLAGACLVFLLMRPMLMQIWVQLFAMVFLTAFLNIAIVAPSIEPMLHGRAPIVSLIAGLAVTATVIVILIVATGTPLGQLVWSIALNSMKFAGEWAVPVAWLRGTLLSAILSVIVCLITGRRLHDVRVIAFMACARLAVAFFLVWQIARLEWFTVDVSRYAISYGVAWAWLFVPNLSTTEGGRARAWLTLLVVLGALQAYPVAGVQIVWGTFLIVPLWILGIADSVPIVLAVAPLYHRAVRVVIAAVLVMVVSGSAAATVRNDFLLYRAARPLRLAGATRTRLDMETYSAVRIMIENAQAHADVLFSLPGLWSTNLWSGLPTPTLSNSSIWYEELDESDQQATIEALARSNRPCLIVRPDILDAYLRQGPRPSGPLFDWINANFEPKFGLSRYELWVKRGREVAALSTVMIREVGLPDDEVVMTVGRLESAIATIQFADATNADEVIGSVESGTPVTVTPIDLTGAPVGSAIQTFLPVQPDQTSTISFRLRRGLTGSPAKSPFLVFLRNSGGSIIRVLRQRS